MDCGPPFGPRAYIASGPLFRQRLLCGPDISRGRLTKRPVPTITNALSPSSIRLGRRPLKPLRRVQIPLVTPENSSIPWAGVKYLHPGTRKRSRVLVFGLHFSTNPIFPVHFLKSLFAYAARLGGKAFLFLRGETLAHLRPASPWDRSPRPDEPAAQHHLNSRG